MLKKCRGIVLDSEKPYYRVATNVHYSFILDFSDNSAESSIYHNSYSEYLELGKKYKSEFENEFSTWLADKFRDRILSLSNLLLRLRDSYTANNYFGFLEDTLIKMKVKSIGHLRADSGLYAKKNLEYLEKGRLKVVNYIIAATFYRPIKLAMSYKKTCLKLDEGLEIAEGSYQA
ncbi:MAG: hypothetical protein KKF62_05895 [Bacteroidetes bacterium]|nr:hypothetical protein [Bacteroidota bacterium]MBU1115883.1 hypothetical protein [Bacteroidota bacterium]MBU1797997.1 hypothetical protein [Bacteroidota bacterium]